MVKGRKWLIDSNTGKTQLVLFDWSNNTGAIDVKMDGSQASAYEACDCMDTPLHMPKTLETC